MPATSTVGALLVPLVLSGEVGGALFSGDCRSAGAVTPLSGLLEVLPRGRRPVRIGTGDLLGLDPLSGYALEGPPSVRNDFQRLLRRPEGGHVFDVVLPGRHELGADPDDLRFLADGGAPWTVANAAWSAPHKAYRIFVRYGVRIGVVPVVDEDLAPVIDPLRRPELRSAAAALDETSTILRGAGIDVVVAVVHVDPERGLGRVRTMLNALEGPPPDVVLTSPLAGDPSEVKFRAFDVTVAAAPPDSSTASVIELLVKKGERTKARVRRVAVEAFPSDSADRIRNWVCGELDVAAAAQPQPRAAPREEFARFLLESMRREAEAEIAILPMQTLGDDRAFPIPPSATRLDIRRALPFDEGLEVARVVGSDLARLESMLSDPRVRVLGLQKGRVSGRPRDPRRRYRVVTVDFVARGGEGFVDPQKLRFRPRRDLGTLREITTRIWAKDGFHPDADPDVDDLIEEPALFDAKLDVGTSLKSVSVANDSGAEAPQLTRRDFLGLSGRVDLLLALDLPKHRFELSGRTRYGIVRESLEGTDEVETRENEDLSILEFVYSGRLAGGMERPWLPDASATARLETEFTVPEERNYRRGLLQLGVGPSWRLTGNLTVRSQLGMRRELFASETSADPLEVELAETRVAILSVAELRNEPFQTFRGRPLLLNVRLDHAVDLSGALRDQVLQGRMSIDVPITNLLSLTAAVDVYVLSRSRRDGSRLSGGALDTSLGIKSSADFGSVFR